MSQFKIRPASRKKSYLKIGIMGPSGSGKTYSSLELAFGLCGNWEDIVVIDSENRSADLYSHKGEYGVLELDAPFSPKRYCEAIDAAVNSGAKVIIIDTMSKEWDGKGGCLETIDDSKLDKSNKSQFTIWGPVTKAHRAFIDRILSAPCHVICTMRSETKYELVDGKPQKLGFAPVQRKDVDFEFGFLFDIARNHVATVSKQRGEVFDDEKPFVITKAVGETIRKWNEEGGNDDRLPAKAFPYPKELEAIQVEYTQLRAIIKAEMGNDIDPKITWKDFWDGLQRGLRKGMKTNDWAEAIEYAESIRSEYHAISEGHLPGVEDYGPDDSFEDRAEHERLTDSEVA